MTASILKMDSLKFLSKLPNSSVDLVVSSPPYFIGKDYDTSCDIGDFTEAHTLLLSELKRCLKDGGSLCWQVGSHVKNGVVMPLDALVYSIFSTGENLFLRNRIIWTFAHGAHCSKRLSGRHETILWFTKGDDYYFDLDSIRTPQKYPGKRHYKGPNKGKLSGNPLGKNPGDVWDIPNVKAGHVEKTSHPCQFPVALVQRLVKSMSPQRGVVVDPYLGSGSTAIAALIEGRKFAGCDTNADYVKIARSRINDLKRGTLLVRPDEPVFVPKSTDTVAKAPEEWIKKPARRRNTYADRGNK